MSITPVRNSVRLHVASLETATYLEELLWTLDAVESVTYHMDGETHFQGLQVIGTSNELEAQVLALLKQYNLDQHASLERVQAIAEEDWAECWKKYWHVNRILPHLVIQPSWEPFTPLPNDTVLKLDPGSAFGTGTHETTQLMLFLLWEWLSPPADLPHRMLDVGTGSGILAIYAAKLGVSECIALDNDPHAVEVAIANARHNATSHQVRCSTQDVSTLTSGAYPLIVANILASILRQMMPDLARTLADRGLMALGGITRSQLPVMLESVKAHHLQICRILMKGEWVALVCQKSC